MPTYRPTYQPATQLKTRGYPSAFLLYSHVEAHASGGAIRVGMTALSAILGLFSPLVFMLGAEPFEGRGRDSLKEVLAGCVAMALYLALCQFLVARSERFAGDTRAVWSSSFVAMIAPLAIAFLAIVVLERPGVVLAQGVPMLFAGCTGCFAGALAARWAPDWPGAHARERHGRMPDRAASERRSNDPGGRSAVLRDSPHCGKRHVAGSHAGTGISWLYGYRRVPSAACRLLVLENPFGSDAHCLRSVRAGLWPVSAVHGFSLFSPRPVRTFGGDCALCVRGKRPPGRLLGNCRGRCGARGAGSSPTLAIASANLPQFMKEVHRFIAACGLMARA